MTHVLNRADNPKEPYGDVEYADPGYQNDNQKRYPLDSAAHVRSAWSYINKQHNASMYDPAQLKDIKARIMAAGKKYGIEFAPDSEPDGDADDAPMRSRQPGAAEIVRFDRTWQLEAIEIQRGGDGRNVEAYAAVWDTPAEVHDRYGHYMESIGRSAFDKFINERGNRDLPVFYNHGMTAAGTPSDIYSVPIGRSVEIRAESRGLWTLSHYNDGPDADRVLEAIRNGAITAQSFRGRVFKSDPNGPIRRSRTGELPHVTRTELGLSEYGPTPSAVYDEAKILALRSREVGIDLEQLLYDELLRRRTSTTPEEPGTPATSEQEAGTDEPPIEALRSGITQSAIARKIEREKIRRRVQQL